MLDPVNDLPSIMILIISVGMFLFAILMPIFVMLIYFELKKINSFLRRPNSDPMDAETMKYLQQPYGNR
jgi:hypothetical protein